MQYTWLVILWLLFGAMHSVFAATKIKLWASGIMKGRYRYHRPVYSLFATVNLLVIVWYHFSLTPVLLWKNTVAEKTIAVLICVPALLVMGISIKKYFMYLSGVDVFLKHRPAIVPHLEQTGLHAYMRHPLYFGTLLFVWCILLWQPSVSNLISCCCITLYTIVGTVFEERKLVTEFGSEYMLYAKRVPMLVPGIKLRGLKI